MSNNDYIEDLCFNCFRFISEENRSSLHSVRLKLYKYKLINSQFYNLCSLCLNKKSFPLVEVKKEDRMFLVFGREGFHNYN